NRNHRRWPLHSVGTLKLVRDQTGPDSSLWAPNASQHPGTAIGCQSCWPSKRHPQVSSVSIGAPIQVAVTARIVLRRLVERRHMQRRAPIKAVWLSVQFEREGAGIVRLNADVQRRVPPMQVQIVAPTSHSPLVRQVRTDVQAVLGGAQAD